MGESTIGRAAALERMLAAVRAMRNVKEWHDPKPRWMCRVLDDLLDNWREGVVLLGPECDIESLRRQLAQWCKDPANAERFDHPAAREIVERFRRSMEPDDEIRRKVYIAILGLECLTIVEGSPADAEPPPGWPGGQETGRYLFIWTKGLVSVLGSGVPTDLSSALLGTWFHRRIGEWKSLQPPGSLPRAVPVEIAPDEDAIKAFIKLAASSPDHWDALQWAKTMLRKRGQPRGEALNDWLADEAKRPDGRRAAKGTAMLLRDAAITGAVGELRQCGMRVTFDREPGPACGAVAEKFGLEAQTVLNIWKSRKRPESRGPTNLENGRSVILRGSS